MTKIDIFTVTGKLWHYHLIGIGVIFSYSETAKQVFLLSEATGVIIKVVDMNPVGGYKSQEDFISDCKKSYKDLMENEVNLNHELMDDPTIIDTPLGGVAIDFNIMMN